MIKLSDYGHHFKIPFTESYNGQHLDQYLADFLADASYHDFYFFVGLTDIYIACFINQIYFLIIIIAMVIPMNIQSVLMIRRFHKGRLKELLRRL